jgi:mRNA-degrading endonuclease RelE of RelBE toxin-antitoxin system
MNPIEKALRKFSPEERSRVEEAIKLLMSGKIVGLDIKKLKGREDIFRIRKGDIRVIYRLTEGGRITILHVGRRNDKTYSS